MNNTNTRPELNITISNIHILTGVTKENFPKFYKLVANNFDKEELRTFHIIIEGKTNIAEMIHIRNYERVRKVINDVLQNNFSNTNSKAENKIVKQPVHVKDKNKNDNTTFEEQRELTPKFLYILTHNVKIKKKTLSTLCECYDSGNVYMLDKKLGKIISKHKNKKASKK